ncbi:MptD family putative ECF transporter S component [Clostridiaceae bacterium M8S5]|nr:MptD family putative ECF transporter S component [Clostridiaceae bacterium M8S5]
MQKKDKIHIKDLITIGIFTAIYFIVFMLVQMVMGGIPIVFLMMPLPTALIGGIIYMLYIAKVPKHGAILIMSTLLAILIGSMLGVWTGFVVPIICGILAEMITGIGKFKSSRWNIVGYSVFSCWMTCGYIPYWIMREAWLAKSGQYYDSTYVDNLRAITQPWVLWALISSIIVVSLLGGLLGKKMLRKHFAKAGIV